MRLAHINLVARDARALAVFYVEVLGCRYLREARMLSGEHVSRGNGVENSQILSIWLAFPGLDHPFLEIHEHTVCRDRELPRVNEPGYGHLAFRTADVDKMLLEIIRAGGVQIGHITDFGTAETPALIAYARDPEGNILELEQD